MEKFRGTEGDVKHRKLKEKKDTYHIDFRRTFCILSVRPDRLYILLYDNRDLLSYNHLDMISGGRRSENRVGGVGELKKNKAKENK